MHHGLLLLVQRRRATLCRWKSGIWVCGWQPKATPLPTGEQGSEGGTEGEV
jgi:hypothetical protein